MNTESTYQKHVIIDEYEINITVARTMLAISGVYLVFMILNELGVFYVDKAVMRFTVAWVILTLTIPALLVRRMNLRWKRRAKYALMTCILVAVLTTVSLLNYHVTLFMVYPILLSIHYRSRRLNATAIIGAMVIALISPFISWWLGLVDVSFIGWLLCLYDPKLLETYPMLSEYIQGTNALNPFGLLLFYGFPNAMIMMSYLLVSFSIKRRLDANAKNLEADVTNIEKEKERALELAEVKSDFLATMSHEIRTPINAVLGMNTAILRESSEANIKNYAKDVDDAGKLLLSIINDILDYSKIDAGKMTILHEKYHTVSLIHACCNMVERRAVEKGLKFELVVNPNTADILYGDEIRLRQIIMNLLNNAIKYTEKGFVRFTVSTKRISDTKVNLVCEIKDSGCGIADENIEKVFEAFDRIKDTEKKGIEGTGLGLAITKKLVELMQGKIFVTSEVNVGSNFTVIIPQDIEGTGVIGTYESTKVDTSENDKVLSDLFVAPQANVLVVDDVELNIKVTKNFLRKTCVQIDTASSGDECLAKCSEKKYDIILLDHAMPGKDGVETLKVLKADKDGINIDTPVVALTANYSQDAKEVYLGYGFNDYLSKPFTIESLQRMMLKFLPDEKIKKKAEE